MPITFQKEFQNSFHSFWMVTFLVNNDAHRNKLRSYLSKFNVETRPIFYPANTMKPHSTKEDFTVADYISRRGINLPSFPELEKEDIKIICNLIIEFFKNNKI